MSTHSPLCDSDGVHVKFLKLFGKAASPPLHHVRRPSSGPRSFPTDDGSATDTARKIDIIESEIYKELASCSAQTFPQTDTAALLSQHIDEACLLYAGRQGQAAATLLLDAVAQPSGCTREPIAWMMLLELATLSGSQSQFEELALRYARRFETSPPQWRQHKIDAAPATSTAAPGSALSLRGKLLGSSAPALAQFRQMAASQGVIRIDLNHVTEVDSAGCALMLELLEGWLAQGRHLELMPAPAVATLLRNHVNGAVKDSNDSSWRLLIELLRISGDESAYEEACIAYSIACEVSPPAPLLQQPVQTTPGAGAAGTHMLRLPAEIVYPIDPLLATLHMPAASLPALLLDCSGLQLIEFNAAAPLLAGITRLANGKPVKWCDLSYLVSSLLQLVGGADTLNIINRKP
jgi:ABC-type transporter Mla MlaB component